MAEDDGLERRVLYIDTNYKTPLRTTCLADATVGSLQGRFTVWSCPVAGKTTYSALDGCCWQHQSLSPGWHKESSKYVSSMHLPVGVVERVHPLVYPERGAVSCVRLLCPDSRGVLFAVDPADKVAGISCFQNLGSKLLAVGRV